jgi:tetratricopeptide (TPR) repeat protein
VSFVSSSFRESIERLEEALPILEAREEFARAAYAGGLLAMAYAITGEFEQAGAMGQRALEWGRSSGDPNALLDAQLFMGRVEAERGNLLRAMDLYRQGVTLAEETGNTLCATVGNLWLGAHHIRMGRPELGAPAIEKSAELAKFCNMLPLRGVGRAWLGAVYYERGEVEKATDAWEAGLKAAKDLGDRLTVAEIRRQRASALAAGHDGWEAARADFEASVAAFETIGARPYLARALRDYGLALQRRGETGSSEAKLRRAALLFEELKVEP